MAAKIHIVARFFLCFSLIPISAHAAPVAEIAGRVMDPDPAGPPKIKRAVGGEVEAKYPALLYGGDHLLLARGQALTVRLGGKRQDLKASEGPLDLEILDPRRGVSNVWKSIFDSVGDVLQRPKVVISTSTQAKNRSLLVGDLVGGAVSSRVLTPPSADPLLPAGEQFLPEGMGAVALVWRGAATNLRLTPAGGDAQPVTTFGHSWASFNVPVQGDFALTIGTGDLTWKVKRSNAVPGPGGRFLPAVSPGDRLARATWLLREGPANWRLFALTEVQDLAASDDFLAWELWNATQSGGLDAALAAQ